jgi:hypothetical protein
MFVKRLSLVALVGVASLVLLASNARAGKQIAIVIDNSGSMFHPIGGPGGVSDFKIFQAACGAEFFIKDLIVETIADPSWPDRPHEDLAGFACELSAIYNSWVAGDWAISVHRFANNTQRLQEQITTDDSGFLTTLCDLLSDGPADDDSIADIKNKTASEAALGGPMTDLYRAIEETALYLLDDAPSFSDTTNKKLIVLLSDGRQTIPRNNYSRTEYETDHDDAPDFSFERLLNDNEIRVIAWGIGSDALAVQLQDLAAQAAPGSDAQVLPLEDPWEDEMCVPHFTTIIQSLAHELVDDNGVLPLAAVGQPPSRLPWQQFSLPDRRSDASLELANHRVFEVYVDGCTTTLILGLVQHSKGKPTLEAISPSGETFAPGIPPTRLVRVDNALSWKIPEPKEGKWLVRVLGDPRFKPLTLDLMARGVFPEFKLHVESAPFQIMTPGKVTVSAYPRFRGKPVERNLRVTAHVPGGESYALSYDAGDGSYSAPVKISDPGITPILVEVNGKLDAGCTIRRLGFTSALVGPATDPRFALSPRAFEQGKDYTVELRLQDARFRRSTQVDFGRGIQTLGFQMLTATDGRATIRVASDAAVGPRTVVTYNPQAESTGSVRVVPAKDTRVIEGRIRCLRFDTGGRLVAIGLGSGKDICVTVHDERLQRILESARDQNRPVRLLVDQEGCLNMVDICE